MALEKQDLTYLTWSKIRHSSGTAGSFLKAYEQGERVHKSMLSRGFNDTSEMFDEKQKLEKIDYEYLLIIILIIIILEIILFTQSGHLGYLGQNLSIN